MSAGSLPPAGFERVEDGRIVRVEPVMGTVFSLEVRGLAGDDVAAARAAVAAAVGLLHAADAAYSTYRPDSLVLQLRRGELPEAARPAELRDILQRCARAYGDTDGWFDPAAGPEGLDPSGLVKGYAVDRAADLLNAAGLGQLAVNGGGDIATRGGPWRIGLQHPDNRDALAAVVEVTGLAVATSGLYERDAHVLDPHTGLAAARAVAATVIGPDLATADAFATGLLAAGPDGLSWLGRHEGYAGLVIDTRRRCWSTAGFDLHRVG